jgi:hypothetical protein
MSQRLLFQYAAHDRGGTNVYLWVGKKWFLPVYSPLLNVSAINTAK